MTQELILKIMNKAKVENDHDYIISQAKVLQDYREAGELTEEVEIAMNEAKDFLHNLLFYPKTQKIFFAEKFETKTLEDYKLLFEKELEEKREAKK